MTTATAAPAAATTMVGMGQIRTSRDAQRLTAVLGSCIAVAVHHPRTRWGAMAHVVLASSGGKNDQPGKFADTAVPHLLALLKEAGGTSSGAVVKLAGGASMFGSAGPLKVGEANIEAIGEALQKAGMRVVGQHLGENKGRRVSLDCATGELTIEIAGRTTIVL